MAVGETTGQVTFAGLPKVKSGILQYELLATNRLEVSVILVWFPVIFFSQPVFRNP